MFLLDSGAETNTLDGEAEKFLQDVVDQPLTSPLLNLDPESPSDDPLPIYDVYISRCINRCRRFLGSPCYITAKVIVDTGSGSSYISCKKAEIMEITPREVHGAGKTVIYAFTKFMVRTGPIKEVTLAYILEEGSGFQYDLLLGRNWMRRYNAKPNWLDNTVDLTCPKTHCSFTMHANPSSSFNFNLEAFPLAADATSNDAPPPEDDNYADLPELTKIDSNDEETDYDADSEDSDTETLVDQTIPDRKWSLNIESGDNPPVKIRGHPHSPPEHEAIRAFIDEGLEDGIVEPSDSPWSAPLILVPKKDGTPLPRIDDCYQNLSGAKYFTLLDLKSGYWQVCLSPDSKQKTAFTCRYGHFQFTVMPFGLCNAPAIFQNMMNDILQPLIDRCAMVYLDDIIVSSRTADDHVHDVLAVIKLLAQEDLGHVVSGLGIRPNPTKVDAIKTWPHPKTITDVCGFLMLCQYYRRFIHSFAKVADGLFRHLRGAPKKGSAAINF